VLKSSTSPYYFKVADFAVKDLVEAKREKVVKGAEKAKTEEKAAAGGAAAPGKAAAVQPAAAPAPAPTEPAPTATSSTPQQ